MKAIKMILQKSSQRRFSTADLAGDQKVFTQYQFLTDLKKDLREAQDKLETRLKEDQCKHEVRLRAAQVMLETNP